MTKYQYKVLQDDTEHSEGPERVACLAEQLNEAGSEGYRLVAAYPIEDCYSIVIMEREKKE